MKVKTEITREGFTIYFEGQACIDFVQQNKNSLVEEIEKHGKVIVDLGKVEFMDSTGLGLLVILNKKMESTGGELFLRNVPEDVMVLIRTTRLEKRFKFL